MIGWLDCAAGASGDMLLGTLVDAGVPVGVLQEAVDAVAPERAELHVSSVTRHGIGATAVRVRTAETDVRRTWTDVRGLLLGASLDPPVLSLALDVFERLARAEAAVHRTTPEHVHFHEVGALDAIADVVGVAAGFVHLGLSALTAGPVTVGSGGSARGAHGGIPVPAPVTLALLADAGAPVTGGPAAAEKCTPTGAALLAALGGGWGPLPAMLCVVGALVFAPYAINRTRQAEIVTALKVKRAAENTGG